MKRTQRQWILGFLVFLFAVPISYSETMNQSEVVAMDENAAVSLNEDYQEYLKFFEKVFETVEKNYYFPVKRETFDKFIRIFNQKIYGQLKGKGKTSNYIKWRSAAYLVDFLKSKEDRFSAFFPPKPAKQYEQEVLGKRIDLGIEGEVTLKGFQVTHIEPRSDAFEKGLRERDVLVKIDNIILKNLAKEKIVDMLTPLENTKVALHYYAEGERQEKIIEVISKEYFKQTVFMIPTDVPGVFCLQIQRFNQKTSEDMTRFMSYIFKQGQSSLIIDLRGNPGGPPLAAREISAFFLPPNEEFVYFQMKNKPKAKLFVPAIPPQFHYKGDIVILVDEKSGSASELFSGILQSRGRAVIMGRNTAGQVLLKSMFYFDDESMVLLVTARGFYPNGQVFSFDGVTPNHPVKENDKELIKYAAQYLFQRRMTGRNLI